MELDDFMEVPENPRLPRLFRHLSMEELARLNPQLLAERKARHKAVLAYCDKKLDDNMDCKGVVCANNRWHAGGRYGRAKEQLRKIAIVESHQ